MAALKESIIGKTSPNARPEREVLQKSATESKLDPFAVEDKQTVSRRLVQNVLTKVHAAREEFAISKERVAQLQDQLQDADDNDSRRLAEIERELAASKAIAQDRRELLKDDRFDALKESKAMSERELLEFKSGKDFLNARLDRRNALVNAVRGALPNAMRRQQEQRDRIRKQCRNELLRCAKSDRTILSDSDIHSIMSAFSEDALMAAKDEKQKNEWMEDTRKNVVGRYLRQAEEYGARVIKLLTDAKSKKAISDENFHEWKGRMKKGNWAQSKEFVDGKLETYVKNWIKVAEERQTLLKDPRVKKLQDSKVIKSDELAKFLSDKGFLNAHYKQRTHLVDVVNAAIKGLSAGPNVQELLVKGRAQLDAAVAKGVLSADKVGHWMNRIASHKDTPKTIEDFLSGKGKDPLSELVQNWTAVRGRFDKVEQRKVTDGPPPSFHFVSIEVFLNWNFDKRETYVEQAEQRFEAYKKDPDEFLKIRHAFDVKDWEEAEELIAKAERMPGQYGPKHQKTLKSLRQYIDAHRPKNDENEAEEPSVDVKAQDTLDSMRGALEQIPNASIRDRFTRALTQYDYQTLWALCTMYYNWEWCRQHGYSSDEQDHEAKSYAKMSAEHAQKTGEFSRGHTVLDATGNTSVTMRKDNDTKSAQGIILDESTDNSELMRDVHQVRNNRAVWYWTRFMEKNVPFEVVQQLIHTVFPVLKKGRRALDSMGVQFTEVGPPLFKTGKRAPEPSKN